MAERLPGAGLFLDEMGALFDEQPVALDRFQRLAGTREGAPHERALNLKHQAMLPLVAAVRLLALRHGVRETDTRRRLAALVGRGALDAEHCHALTAAHARLQGLLLAEQRRNLAAGRHADGWVDIARLGEDERLLLRHDLQRIRVLQKRARRG